MCAARLLCSFCGASFLFWFWILQFVFVLVLVFVFVFVFIFGFWFGFCFGFGLGLSFEVAQPNCTPVNCCQWCNQSNCAASASCPSSNCRTDSKSVTCCQFSQWVSLTIERACENGAGVRVGFMKSCCNWRSH